MKICGDNPELSFTADEDLNMAEVWICFSGNTTDMDHAHQLMKFTIGGYTKNMEWSPADVSMVINDDHLPCGSGYLIAEVRNNGMRIAAEYEKAMRVCDNTDIDLSLQIESTMKMMGLTPQLYTGRYSNDLLSQLLDYLDITKAVIHNHGNRTLANSTIETPHMVAVYLQARHQMTSPQNGEMCYVPRYKIIDQFIGKFDITAAIGAGEAFDIVPHFHGHYIPDTSIVCGDAELVIFYDPLMIDQDSNICNNFLRIPVSVMCSNRNQRNNCILCPNPVDLKTWALFGNMTFYEFDDMEGEWTGRDLRMMNEDTLMELVHAGMSQMMQQHLSNLYSHSSEGICMFVDKLQDETMDRIQKMAMIDIQVGEQLEMKIQAAMKEMQSSMDVSSSLQSFLDWGEMEMDPVNKSLIIGSYTGLSMVYGVNMLMLQSRMTGTRFPSNTTRMMLGQMLRGMGQLNYVAEMHPMMASMYGLEMLKYAQALRLVTHFLHENQLLPVKVAHVMMKLTGVIMSKQMNPMSNQTGSNSWTMPSMNCPFGPQMNLVSKALLKLSNGWDGEVEYDRPVDKDRMKMAMCRTNILRVFMLKGGYKLIRKAYIKRILMENGMKPDDLMRIPKECRRHPFQPYDSPMENVFVDDDGKIMKGAMSPLEDTVTYKMLAKCHCENKCPENKMDGSWMGGSGPGMWATTTPSMMSNMWESVTKSTQMWNKA